MSILRELNDAISKGTPESRLKALWHATDMLLMGRYTESEIWIFGEVIGRLSEEIELAARSQLAKRLARSDKAPIYMINKLASDDSIDVAGPVLRYSERLGNQVLVANARCKSQRHLFAISRRKKIDEPVTDVLVARGDQTVVNSVAVNTGARFSDFGLSAPDQAFRERLDFGRASGTTAGHPEAPVPAIDREGIRRCEKETRVRAARGRDCGRQCRGIDACDVRPGVEKLLCRQKDSGRAPPSRRIGRSRDFSNMRRPASSMRRSSRCPCCARCRSTPWNGRCSRQTRKRC